MTVSSNSAVDFSASMGHWLIKFDRVGNCVFQKNQGALLDGLNGPPKQLVFPFLPRWNYDFDAAAVLYRKAFPKFEIHLQAQHSLFKPPLVRVVWPSLLLSFGESMRIVGSTDQGAATAKKRYVTQLAAALSCSDERRRRQNSVNSSLHVDLETEHARLLGAAFQSQVRPPERTVESGVTPDVDDLLEIFFAFPTNPPAARNDEFPLGGMISECAGATDRAAPQRAGLLSFFGPRWLLRIVSVYQMKDRLGTVEGVTLLINGLLIESTKPRGLHPIGHSFHHKIPLSAMRQEVEGTQAQTALLRPAISHLVSGRRHQIQQHLPRHEDVSHKHYARCSSSPTHCTAPDKSRSPTTIMES